MSQIAQKLRAAGFTPTEDRLRSIANDALAEFPKDWPATAVASAEARTDPLWPKLKEIAVEALKINPRNWDGAKDAVYRAVRNDAALLWALFEPYRALAVQKLLSDAARELREAAQAVQEMDRGPSARREPEKERSRAGQQAVAAVARLSLLDTFKINSRPIGDCTPEEANGWASSRERDARFVRLLTANLPPGQPIRKYRRAEDTQEIYERAAQETRDVE